MLLCCIRISPGVVIEMGLLNTPVPTLFNAATSTSYVVDGSSPSMVTWVSVTLKVCVLPLPCTPCCTVRYLWCARASSTWNCSDCVTVGPAGPPLKQQPLWCSGNNVREKEGKENRQKARDCSRLTSQLVVHFPMVIVSHLLFIQVIHTSFAYLLIHYFPHPCLSFVMG